MRFKAGGPRRGAVWFVTVRFRIFELLNGAVRCGSGQEFYGAVRSKMDLNRAVTLCAAKSTVTLKYAFRCTKNILYITF